MNLDLGNAGVWAIIAVMAAVTFAIRAGGFFLMGFVPITGRVRAVLNALPGAVIVAIVLPLAVRSGPAAGIAVSVSLLVMALRRNDLFAVVCGVAAAALWRAFWG